MTSVNTNYGALVALQSLNNTTKELGQVQNHVNTGLKVASAADNGAVFAIAEGQRARVLSISAVQDGIDRASSVISVGLSAGEAIGDILKQLKEKTVAAQASDLSQDQRDALQADFSALRNQINQIANAATFNGSNVVNGANLSGTGNAFNVVTSDQAGSAGSANAGYFLRGTAGTGAAGSDTLGALALTTDITITDIDSTTGTQSGADTGDRIEITVGSSVFVAAITNGDTLGDVIDNINTATGGVVTAAFDATNNQVTYNSTQAFSVDFVDAGATAADSVLEGIFSGNAASAGTGAAYVAGGGYQASGTAIATAPSPLALLGDTGIGVANGDVLTLTLFGADGASGGGDDTTYNITLSASTTIQDFQAQVSSATAGRVSAHYNSDTGLLTYQAQEAFTAATSGTSAFLEGAGTLTAALAPSSNGGSSSGASASSLSVAGFDFRLGTAGQALSGVTASLDISSVAGASAATTAIDAAITGLNKNLATLGAQAKALDVQKTFLGKLSDSIQAGIGNLVDADLAKESAKLQALQVKQQLGAQALSIANQAPSIVLSFFR
jgi:flagellin